MAARVAFAYGARRAARTDGIDTCDGDAIGSSLIIADGEFRATMEGQDEYLLQCLKEKIASGYDMIERLRLVDKIDGIDKLIRKIQQEIKFLEKARYTRDLVHFLLAVRNRLILISITLLCIIYFVPIDAKSTILWLRFLLFIYDMYLISQ